MKRDTRTAYRRRAAAMERLVDESLAQTRADKEAEKAERAAKYQARKALEEANRKHFTNSSELNGMQLIRTSHGWHRIVKVNAKSVIVPSIVGGSWTDRMPFEKIIDAR